MARPTIIDDHVILEAARQAFLKHGFSVPTAEIAKRAGISEGSIFKRFATKADLFSAALKTPTVLPWLEAVETRFEHDDARQAMTEIAEILLRFYRKHLPIMLKVHAHIDQLLRIPEEVPAPPVQALQTLSEFFRRQAQRRKLKIEHPEATARMFLGSMMNYAFFELLFNENQTSPEDYVGQVVQTLWNGISPEADQR